MPQIPGFAFPRRYNSLRLLGYDYHSVYQLCAISLVTELRRPLFADMILAKAVLASLLSDENLGCMRVRAFTLMPDHLHFLAGVRHRNSTFQFLLADSRAIQPKSTGNVVVRLWIVAESPCRRLRCAGQIRIKLAQY